MKLVFSVLTIFMIISVNSDGLQYRIYEDGEETIPNGHHGFDSIRRTFPGHALGKFSRNSVPLKYGAHRNGKDLHVVYGTTYHHILPRHHIHVATPMASTHLSPVGYNLNGIYHPSATPASRPQLQQSPGLELRIKNHPRFALSPIRQYVPHNFPRYSPEVAIPPKKIHMHSGLYSSVPPGSKKPINYYQSKVRKGQNSGNIKYLKHNSKAEDDEPDDDDDYSEDYENKNEFEAEDRSDGSSGVNTLTDAYNQDKENKENAYYSKKNGDSYEDEKKSKKGHKTSTGHESEHKFDKGEKGHYDKEVQTKEYEDEGENKERHHDEEGKHGSHNNEDHGEKKGEFVERKKHRKGSKTKGYHNVFHKDEFVKDHTFYDDLDQSGHYKKYEEEHQGHKKDQAEIKKGAHKDSGKKQTHEAHHGKYSKDYNDDADSGYEKNDNHSEQYEKDQDYKEKGGEAKKLLYDYVNGF